MKNVQKISAILLVVVLLAAPGAFASARSLTKTTSTRTSHNPAAISAVPLPDLVVTGIQWTEVFPYSNCGTPALSQSYPDPYTYFCVTVQNQGAGPVTLQSNGPNTFYLTIYKGATVAAQMKVAAPVVIGAGASRTLYFNGIVSPNHIKSTLGSNAFTATVDSTNAVPETNEANNSQAFSITINP